MKRDRYVDVVMNVLPGHGGDFVELEDEHGAGLGPPEAEWLPREDGTFALRIFLDRGRFDLG